ncbi:vitamin D-binding protein [Falco rusticolus]|uniref:vitamin D-binding protein n=1 Tax=Falco rusticolus TaxID=120794 RepID=UPI000FFB9E74|nr:vitamin D-binding protein [Falco rusticolus]XP_055556764.1 vitamin D-binding protein [Falco cherrug]
MGFPALLFGWRRETGSNMRAALSLMLLLAAVRAEHRGKAYVRDKVCQEFKALGKEDFRTLTIIANSRKFSNATFEEISHLVHEIVSLAETCCTEGADPSCYDDGSSALSAKSCSADSPFPSHPGTAGCCAHEGLEQKLCLAALRHPPQDLPRYLQPSNEEICQAFKKDPKDFADRFLHDYASSYSQAPLPVLLGSTKSFLSMVSTCCISQAPTACFLKEKLERKTISLLTLMSNRVCSRFTAYGKDKLTFSYLTSLAQKMPSASFENIFPLAEDAAEVFSQCCDSVAEDCMQKKLSEHTAKVCSMLSAQDARFANCCKGKNLMQNYFCILALPPAPAHKVPDTQKPSNEQLCSEDGPRHVKRYLFELVQEYPSIPDAFFGKIYDASKKVRGECCSAKDSAACLDSKRQQMGEELPPFLEKTNQLCGQYNKLNFLDFKKRLRESLTQTMPEASPELLGQLVEQQADFASTCCPPNSPPLYCASKVSSELEAACKGGSCLLGSAP